MGLPAEAKDPRPLAGVHVLVVDDNPDARDMLKEALMHDGATVTTCESAIEALDAFRHVVPEALVSDIAMLRENGYWLIEQVRTLPPERGGRIPAVAITAYGTLFDRRRALEAGFDAYLQKPFDPWELCRVVAAITANT